MRSKAEDDVQESIEEIAEIKEDITELTIELEEELDTLQEKWAAVASDVTEVPVTPYKKDINLPFFGVAWLPYYLAEADGQLVEFPAVTDSM